MILRKLKYLIVFTPPLAVALSLNTHGVLTFFPLLYAFAIVPLLDYVAGKDKSNWTESEKERVAQDWFYDFLIYLTVPIQIGMLLWFLWELKTGVNTTLDLAGKITGMGMMCGVYGINVAHELGHRTTKWEQAMAKLMLASSLYMHFFIEHNRGHHRNVGTPDDGATARKNQNVYAFWMRTIVVSFISAWKIVEKERKRKKLLVWSIRNEMIGYILFEIAICIAIAILFGSMALIGFLLAAAFGIVLLETVNYIEHYGLFRKKVSEHRYEDVEVWHSWNADFIIGRLILFELTRHSDHHWEPSKHYEFLESVPHARQLPAGYPAMMLLALFPPLWFKIMNPRLGEADLLA